MKMKLPDMKSMAVKTKPAAPTGNDETQQPPPPAIASTSSNTASSSYESSYNNHNNIASSTTTTFTTSSSFSSSPSSGDETSQKWSVVETTLREIFNKQPITGSFQVLHKIVFTLATSSPQYEYDQLKKFLRALVSSQRDEQVAPVLARGDGGGAVLQRLASVYENFAFAILKYSHLFLHLDRHWCPAQRQAGVVPIGRDIFGQVMILPVDALALSSNVLASDPGLRTRASIITSITTGFLEAIRRERDGEDAADHNLLKNVCSMLLEVGHQTTLNRLIVDPFLKASLQFFEAEASRLLAALPAPEYLLKYQERSQMESSRCQNVFPNYRYTQAVLDAMTNTYIKSRKNDILNQPGGGGLKMLAAEWKLREIATVYKALSAIQCGNEVVAIVCEHLLSEFNRIAAPPKPQQQMPADPSGTKPNPNTPAQSAKEVMGRCMSLLDKAKDLVDRCFVLENGKRDRSSEAQVNKTVEMILNADDSISEQLAIHHDATIRAQPTDDELEKCCEDICSVFSRLRNKDVFELVMKTFLAKRMLMVSKSQTEEEHKERILINMLKREVGSAVTSKFEGMFHDKRTSEEVCATFHRKLEARAEKMPVDIDVVVVTDGLWPQLPVLPLQHVPKEIQRSIQLFSHFYMGLHKGRRLDFLYSQGTAEVRLNVPKLRKPYELNIPTFCLPVLLLFQTDDVRLTPTQIAEQVGMTPQDTSRAIASLSRATQLSTGVLNIENPSAPSQSVTTAPTNAVLTANSIVSYNQGFKSRTNKVKFAAAQQKAAAGGGSSSSASGGITGDGIGGNKSAKEIVEEDRKFRIDATIVRIMKSRRAMNHSLLVTEAITALKSGFAATPAQIKHRIENLIDREFLIRNEEGDGYIYKA